MQKEFPYMIFVGLTFLDEVLQTGYIGLFEQGAEADR